MSSRVILLAGKKNVGKSTTAGIIAAKLTKIGLGVARMSFATPIKEFTINALGYSYEQVYGTNEQKETPGPWNFEDLDPHLRYPIRSGPVSGRQMLQILGTDVFRNTFSSIIWIKAAQEAVKRSREDMIIFDDVRMPNECEAFAGAFKVKIERPGFGTKINDGHATENALDCMSDDYWNSIIINSGSLIDLEEAAKALPIYPYF